MNTGASTSAVSAYHDFVIAGRRIDSGTVHIEVKAAPAGRTSQPQVVAFDADQASRLHASFVVGRAGSTVPSGRMMISQAEATDIGKQLAAVLFPPEVFRLFAYSLRMILDRPRAGLRIRLAMDDSLVDLPWEYVYRPDRMNASGISGFLVLDPAISLVREAADPRITIRPTAGRTRLSFVGTLWEGGEDGWEVRKEFSLLSEALAPVSRYIEPEFAPGSDPAAFKPVRGTQTAIFQYAGHCDLDAQGRPYLIRTLPMSTPVGAKDKVWIDDLAATLKQSKTRLAVMSACNSGFGAVIRPLLAAGVPAAIGINGGIASISTIEFCTKLYESLAVGLTLDEAVARARLHVLEWGRGCDLFDWGLYMVYMPCADATLFPKARNSSVSRHQDAVRQEHAAAIDSTRTMAKELDGMNFGEIMTELSRRRVLILGRFTGRRLKMLKAISKRLENHPNRYIPELFTYQKPDNRDLVESIVGFAALSRFIIADLSEPKSIQSELEAVVPHFQSIPVVPVINQGGKEYATFASIQRRTNVIKPTTRYRDVKDLLAKLEALVPLAEQKRLEVEP